MRAKFLNNSERLFHLAHIRLVENACTFSVRMYQYSLYFNTRNTAILLYQETEILSGDFKMIFNHILLIIISYHIILLSVIIISYNFLSEVDNYSN